MRVILGILLIGLTACVSQVGDDDVGGGGGSGSDIGPPLGTGSGSDTGGGGSATARDYFNANVYPALASTCGSSSCHSATSPGTNAPAYVSTTTPTQDDTTAYNLIVGMSSVVGSFGATAPLLSVPANTAHYAKFTTNQVTSINDWFALEISWRAAAGGGSGSGASTDYMAVWSGCMQLTDFTTANVAKAYAAQVNTNEGYCQECHVNGQAQSYFIANPDPAAMFSAISTYREYLSTFFTIDTTTNTVVVNTVPFQLAADGGTNGEHPIKWDPANNKGMKALTDFATLTTAHLNGTTQPACGASTLSD